jgi:hypothetical protein
LGVLAVAFAILVLQVATPRLLSVVLWCHFAFVAISLAMLGLALAGVLSLAPRLLQRTPHLLPWYCGLATLATVAFLVYAIEVYAIEHPIDTMGAGVFELGLQPAAAQPANRARPGARDGSTQRSREGASSAPVLGYDLALLPGRGTEPFPIQTMERSPMARRATFLSLLAFLALLAVVGLTAFGGAQGPPGLGKDTD